MEGNGWCQALFSRCWLPFKVKFNRVGFRCLSWSEGSDTLCLIAIFHGNKRSYEHATLSPGFGSSPPYQTGVLSPPNPVVPTSHGAIPADFSRESSRCMPHLSSNLNANPAAIDLTADTLPSPRARHGFWKSCAGDEGRSRGSAWFSWYCWWLSFSPRAPPSEPSLPPPQALDQTRERRPLRRSLAPAPLPSAQSDRPGNTWYDPARGW